MHTPKSPKKAAGGVKMPLKYGYFRILTASVLFLALTCTTAHAQWTWTPEVGGWINPKRQPRETPALQYQYAEELLAEGDTENAISEYEKVLRFFPASNYCDLAQYSIGRALEAQEDYEESVKAYQTVIDEYPNTKLFENVLEKQRRIADRFFELGVERQERFTLLRGGNFERAIETYRQVIDNQPFTAFSAVAQYRIGLSYFKMELYEEAGAEFEKLLDFYPASELSAEAAFGAAASKYLLALPHEYDKTASEEAVAKFRSFIRFYPDSKRVSEAEEKIERLRQLVAKHEYEVGAYYHRNMKYQSARLYFDSVVRNYSETKWAEKASEKLREMP
jgi:outer membrane assembly lipoprotein YfiO